MGKIMILGAGISQMPLIQKAKEMGLHVIVISRQGNYPGFALADQVYYEDTTNAEKILEIALSEKIDGICTTGTDVAVKSIGKVVDRMGLSGVHYDSAVSSSNKLKMKEAFMEYGVRTARFIKVVDKQDAYNAFRQLEKPVMFKAVDSGASKGIIRVDDEEKIEYAFDVVKKATKMNFFLVEEFIEGIEFGAQAFIYNNEIQFIMLHGDTLFYGDTGVPIGHYVPYELPEETVNDVSKQLSGSIEALKLNNCAINADFILKEDKVYVLEIGARAGATCLPELVSIYYGFDYYEQIINAALRRTPDFNIKTLQPCACDLLISNIGGEIVSLDNENEEHEDIVQISFDYKVGDTVNKFKVGTDRVGQIVVKGDTLEKAIHYLNEIKSKIKIDVRVNP